MRKIVELVRRRPGVSHQELVTAWRALATDPGVGAGHADRHVVTLFRPRAGEHDWDGMAVLWFDEDAGGTDAAGSDLGPALGGEVATMADVVRLSVDEHVFFDRPTQPEDEPLKLTFLVVGRPGVPHEEVVRHWVDVHGPAVAAPMADVPGARRYVASPALSPAGGYTGVTELSYASRQASAAHAAALVDDGFGRLADNGIYLVAEEELVIR